MNQPKSLKNLRHIFGLMPLLALVLAPTSAIPGENDVTSVSVLKYSAGIVTAGLIHEGAHALVAGVTGTHMSWELGTYNQPIGFTENAGNDAKGVALYSAGLLAQVGGSEIILQVDKIDKNDAFVRGMMTWNILNPILYSLDYWVFRISNKGNGNNYQGDLEGIEHYSNERTANAFALSMSAIAVFQGYRFLKTQTWAPDWMKTKLNNFTLSPMPSGGFFFTYKFTF
jgi:hypothetical protein